MTTFSLSVGFFFIGLIEWYLDTWEKLVSARLKIWSTILYSTLNQTIDFFMYVFLFSILIQFWETWHNGVHDYYKLIPYILYTIGKIAGTVLATWWYARQKKQSDKARAVKLLETSNKARKKRGKKKLKKQQHSVEVGNLFDSVETEDLKDEIKAQVVENVSQKISDKVDEALKQNES
ncbi:MAG: hypothetical protein ACREBR_05115 [bacterium]